MNDLPDNTCDEIICLTMFKMNSLPDIFLNIKKIIINNKTSFRIKYILLLIMIFLDLE